MKPGLTIALTLAAALFTGRVLHGQASRAAEAQFKAAQNTEQVEGDLKGAIEQYKKLAQGSDRAVAAKALARLTALQSSPVAQVGQTLRLLSTDLVGRSKDGTGVGPPSADGRYLSYSAGDGVAVLDLKFGTILSLKNLGDAEYYAENSVVSPDGRQVAYVWDMTPMGHDVRVAQVTGGNAPRSRSVHLNPGNGDVNNGHVDVLGWSPDGKNVLITRELRDRRDLAVISIADGGVRVLRDALIFGEASFSPNGRYVVYAARPRGATTGADVFVVTADGSQNRVVVEAPGDDRNPMWSPDGSHVVFLSNRTGNLSLWMVPVAGGLPAGPAQLVKANVAPFSPLGITRIGALYFIAGDATSNVFTAELDVKMNAAGTPSMATNQYINANRGGAWSPDGQSVAYIVSTPRAFVRIRSVKTGEDREVPTQLPIVGSVKWFPDGRSLLLASRDARLLSGNLGYYRVTVASGQSELLHQTASRDVVSTRPDISPDGRTILYLESPVQPVRFDIDSRRETRLPPLGEFAQEARRALSLAVSPDATQIAYVGAQSLMVTPAAGGEPREVVRFSGESSPRERAEGMGLAWSSDGRFLFFVRPDARGIWRVPLAGGPAEDIGVSMGRIRALRMHPDGRRIAFDSVVDAPSEVWALENFLPKARVAR